MRPAVRRWSTHIPHGRPPIPCLLATLSFLLEEFVPTFGYDFYVLLYHGLD